MIRQELETVCRHGVILTSSFSGTGGFEAMALQVLDECAKVFGMPQPKVIFYSACDILPESEDGMISSRLRQLSRLSSRRFQDLV